ncbi:MAG: long-chain fatty acid--CoA ligase, partial [bacterium]|nr:long-chain fatty acid--CoA ligase [bacterium]
MLKENFGQMITESIIQNWELPAFSNFNESAVTYGKVAEKILWWHYIFQKCHIKKGDKIAVIGKNASNWAIAYLSVITYGAVIVPILPDFQSDDVQHIVNHSNSVLLFASENIYDKIDENKMPDLEGIFSLDDYQLLYAPQKNIAKILQKADSKYLEKFNGNLNAKNVSFENISNEDAAAVVYTSGTSGFSKGVLLPHNSLAANVRFARRNIPLKARDEIVSFLPLAHTFGCAFDLLFPFCVGCHIHFLGKIPSPKILIKAFSQVRPRLILSVPLVIEKIYKNHLKAAISKPVVSIMLKLPVLKEVIHKKIRKKLVELFGGNFLLIVIGGAALNDEVEQFLTRIKFPFTVGYGMTECGPLISYKPWPYNKVNAVGQLVDTLEVRIDSAATGTNDGTGEIQVRGENVMNGYYKNEEATKSTIDKNGWLHTGDIGSIDDDGFIFIKGRHKSMLLGASGQNIYPEEIEARLNNCPYVSESLLIEKDKKIVALVHPDLDAADSESLDENGLQQKMEKNRLAVNQQLPAFSRIMKIELYPEEFEKTPTKKIKRFL